MNASFFSLVRGLMGWSLFWCAPVVALAVIAYFLTTIPARRKEKNRLFLDLLLNAVRDGKSPEQAVIGIAETRESILGARFYLVAAYIEEGRSLLEALRLVPGYLPPGIIGFMETGKETGKLYEAIRAGQQALGRKLGRSGTAMHYAFVLIVMMLPFALLFLPFWQIFIWPKFRQIFADMEVPMPLFTTLVSDSAGWIALAYAAIAILAFILFYFYLSPPRLFKRRGNAGGAMIDRVIYAIPWRRKRAQRDFSVALALLLESGVPEGKALVQAGESSGNRYLAWRSRRAARQLEQGTILAKAIHFLDDRGEFAWRLNNAIEARAGFMQALNGWHEALESEAWRAEETAAHFVSAIIILMNGAFVGAIISAVFLSLISVIDAGVLW